MIGKINNSKVPFHQAAAQTHNRRLLSAIAGVNVSGRGYFLLCVTNDRTESSQPVFYFNIKITCGRRENLSFGSVRLGPGAFISSSAGDDAQHVSCLCTKCQIQSAACPVAARSKYNCDDLFEFLWTVLRLGSELTVIKQNIWTTKKKTQRSNRWRAVRAAKVQSQIALH